MRNIVIDANVVIDYTRDLSNDYVELLEFAVKNKIVVYIPTVVIFELFAGREIDEKGKRMVLKKLLDRLKRIDLTEEIAILAADLYRKHPFLPLDIADFAIAASALVYKAELATKNKKHFKQIPKLQLFDFAKLR